VNTIPTRTELFKSGQDAHHTYRIPCLAITTAGTVLAFCEGRKHARSDTGDIALLCKRSTDGGYTWSEQHVIWDDPGHTCGNPSPVVDQTTGTIWLWMTWNRGDEHPYAAIVYARFPLAWLMEERPGIPT
jgi:sialidase-1